MSTALESDRETDSGAGRSTHKGLLISLAGIALAGLIVFVVAVSGGFSSTPRGVVFVQLQLLDMQSWTAGCVGQGGYSDIAQGAPVVIRDEAGKAIAEGQLSQGRVGGSCDFDAQVTGVPLDRPFYSVEVSHRGQVTESRAELSANGWTFRLSLGSLFG